MHPGEVAALLFGTFAILVIVRVPVAFALGLACVPVIFIDDGLTPALLLNEMWSSYNSFILLAVPFFLLAANLMNAAGITERLIRLSQALVGHLPGGLGHVNVLVSMLFAGISGSSTADAAGIGALMIPAMKKQGYDSGFSVAITACSSVLGVIIPPSILMIVWSGLMSVSVSALFLAGIIPGVMIALSMMTTVFIYARVRNYPTSERSSFSEIRKAIKGAVLALITPVIVVGGIVRGWFTPTEASVIAVVYSAALGCFVFRSIERRKLPKVVYESARLAAISLFCIGTASAFGKLLAYYRIPQALVGIVSGWGTGVVTTGLIVAGVFLFVGMFIDAIPAIIIMGTVLLPLAKDAGMHPVQFAIIGVISLAVGLVTPPYGLCLLISCELGEIRIVQALKDVGIILLPIFVLLIAVILFPEIVLFLPKQIAPKFLN